MSARLPEADKTAADWLAKFLDDWRTHRGNIKDGEIGVEARRKALDIAIEMGERIGKRVKHVGMLPYVDAHELEYEIMSFGEVGVSVPDDQRAFMGMVKMMFVRMMATHITQLARLRHEQKVLHARTKV